MADSRIDRHGIAEAVVMALLGEPNRRLTRGRRWRYGTKGSLSVDLDKAARFDFEAEAGGGVSKLVEREQATDWKGARRWQEQEGFIEPWRPDPNRRAERSGRDGGARQARSRGAGAGTPGSRPTGAGPAPRADDSTGDPKAKARIARARALVATLRGERPTEEALRARTVVLSNHDKGDWPVGAGNATGRPVEHRRGRSGTNPV